MIMSPDSEAIGETLEHTRPHQLLKPDTGRSSPLHAGTLEHTRLHQLLIWLTPTIFAFALLFGITAFIFGDWPTGGSAVVVFGYGILLLAAWRQLRRHRLVPAVHMVSGGLLGTVLIMTVLQPPLYPNFAIVPLLAAATILAYSPANRRQIIACWLAMVLIAVTGEIAPFQTRLPAGLLSLLRVSSLVTTGAFVLLLVWQFSSRLGEMLAQMQAANQALQAAHGELETRARALQAALVEVEERAAAQARLLNENEQQRVTIQELSVPVLPINDQTLIMPLIGALDSTRLMLLQDQALHVIERTAARRLLLDITGVPVVDSQVAQGLLIVVQAARLLGADVRLIGIRPEVAQTIVGLGLDLTGMQTFTDLQTALA